MKSILFLLLLTSFISVAQKKGLQAYGLANIELNKFKYPGLGVLAGFKLTKNLCLGAGIELTRCTDEIKGTMYPVYGDIRYFLNHNNKTAPFVAVDFGYLEGKIHGIQTQSSTSYNTFKINGGSLWGFEIGCRNFRKQKAQGPEISVAFKNCSFEYNQIVTYMAGTITNSFGIRSQIRNNMLALKLGYYF